MERRFTVTLEARRRRANIPPTRMAIEAGGVAMRTREREARQVVIEGDFRPAVGRVAGAAVTTELTGMSIIVLVTADTICWCPHIDAIDMAIRAGDVNMCTGQQEARTTVIEDVIGPGRGDVALTAVDNKLARMIIVFGVATGAVAGDPDPLALDMAVFAIQGFMTADEIKPGELMREERIRPGGGCVAGTTFFWNALRVNVLFEMAVDALT